MTEQLISQIHVCILNYIYLAMISYTTLPIIRSLIGTLINALYVLLKYPPEDK